MRCHYLRFLLFLRYLCVLLCFIFISACGFRSLDGTSSKVHVALIPEREGQLLRGFLVDEFGKVDRDKGEYVLAVRLFISSARARANYELFDAKGALLLNEQQNIAFAFSALPEGYVRDLGFEDVTKKALRQLSYTIAARISVFLQDEERFI